LSLAPPTVATVQARRPAALPVAGALSPDELRRAARHPISRWLLVPLAALLAQHLAATRLRPWHVTLCGAALFLAAAALLNAGFAPAWLAALCLLAAWFCDRLDGILARRQGTATAWGAWLDSNLDEAADIGLHAAAAWAASAVIGPAAWIALAAFASGKYLFMHSLVSEESLADSPSPGSAPADSRGVHRLLRAAYHLPANADIRIHLLAVAVLTGWLVPELVLLAAYYHLRWIARFALVARRLPGGPQ
jgi:phosphatidylglycerophosphate synthase